MADPPKVFISYSQDSDDHAETVRLLAERLNNDRLQVTLDQWIESPEDGWPLWSEKQVLDEQQSVLMVCTETYRRRAMAEEETGTGLGAAWEARIIRQCMFDAGGRNTRFIPVLIGSAQPDSIPRFIKAATYYRVDISREYARLLNRLRPRPAARPLAAAEQPPQTAPIHIFNVPFPRNPVFTGRDEFLAELHRTLDPGDSTAISGLGGIGKTQAAVEYAYRHWDDYDHVLWVTAADPSATASGYGEIASLLGLPEAGEADEGVVVEAVKRWLETHEGWLLILDNADDLKVLPPFLPATHQGRVLITTRSSVTGGLARRLDLQKMPVEEGALFLLRRGKRIGGSALLESALEEDREAALALSKEMDGLPLALDQAGAYIEEAHVTPKRYLELYLKRGKELRDLRHPDEDLPADHVSVTVTFTLAFDKVKANAAAADLVRLCAFLAPDAIPEEIFTKGASHLTEPLREAAKDPLKWDKAVGEACRYSLLERDPDACTLTMHRVVQAVVRDGMAEAEQRTWAERAVNAVDAATPGVEFANWPLCERLLPHQFACAEHVDRYAIETPTTAHLLNQAGNYLRERARYPEAEPLNRRALAVCEKALGREHPNTAQSLNNLAGLLQARGDLARAEPLYRQALAIDEKALGPEHPDTATSLNNLAGLLRARGDLDGAEPLFRRALAIVEQAVGPEHPSTAGSINNLAGLLEERGDMTAAEPLYRRALEICEKVLGPEHPDTATSLNNLAGLLRAQGNLAGAEPLCRQALAIREKTLGPEHPTTAQSLNNLAALLYAQGNLAGAEALQRRALATVESVLGPEHSDVAHSLNNLAVLLWDRGDRDAAVDLCRRARGILHKSLGGDHPDTRLADEALRGMRREMR